WGFRPRLYPVAPLGAKNDSSDVLRLLDVTSVGYFKACLSLGIVRSLNLELAGYPY
ncbi:MAG: hypothetical protein JWN70_2808, partial [Planctomycetaceae bacterium]|nr:hypothetical protein [Planctomycetaceae bacterium]